MKRRSKLFLVVSLILVGVGVLLCLVGWLVSGARSEQLFADKLGEGERGYTYEFRDGDLDILKLSVGDADINIIGGADKPRIEIINFNESLYTFELSGAMATFRQSPDLSSFASFWEGGFSFKGLRYFLHSGAGGRGKINVYINDDEYIKVFDLTCTKGSISISDVDSISDWQLHVGSGGVLVKNVSGASTVNISSQETGRINISLDRLTGENVNISVPDAKLSAEGLCCRSLDIQQSYGVINADFTPMDEECAVDIITSGKLTVDGENYIDRYQYPPKDQNGSDNKGGSDDEEALSSKVSVNTSVSSAEPAVTFSFNGTIKNNNTAKDDK